MPQRFSDSFGISHDALAATGAYDAFLDVDSPFYVDPYLIRTTQVDELSTAAVSLEGYFRDVIYLLQNARGTRDRLYREAFRRLHFPEHRHVHLGYSRRGTAGSGIGRQLASRLTATAKQIVDAGIVNPRVFELVGLFEEGIGADRMSDMAVHIIWPHLLRFTQRVARELELPTRTVRYRGQNLRLPWLGGMRELTILVPVDLLRDLPVAAEWHDIDLVCAHNRELRNRVNPIIGSTWKDAVSRRSKRELREAIMSHPGLLEDLLRQYEAKKAEPYDLERDPKGYISWHRAREYAVDSPLDLLTVPTDTVDDVYIVVERICKQFAHLIEDRRMYRLFYNDDGSLRKEKYAQLTFYVVGSEYCRANDLDISPETDAGAGPVDFKISRGARAKVTVEVKYSSNSHLVRGYTEQLATYNRAESTDLSIYLVIRTTESTRQIERLLEQEEELRSGGQRAPSIIVVDGRPQEAASRRR